MVNNIFKALFLIVAICLTLVLYGIYRNMEQANRYKILDRPSGFVVFDTETKAFYRWNPNGMKRLGD